MKKVLLVLFGVIIIAIVWKAQSLHENSALQQPTPFANPAATETITPITKTKTSIFVPYWSLGKNPISVDSYDKVLYFGITVNAKGIDKSDPGYLNLQKFVSQVSGKEKLLVLRMINTDVNTKILDDIALQKKIAQDASWLARQNGFSGVVLDFEQSALGFDSVKKSITAFYTAFEDTVKNNNLSFSVTMYGDVFYRVRPYDLEKIGKITDRIYILAYDFHKAGGDPGSNFPLRGADTYGYDFEMMLTDFAKAVPREKLTVVFGMFGYDWTVDEKGRSEKQAVSITDLEAAGKFTNCSLANCIIKHDSVSSETKVTYTDIAKQNHIVWFENMDSVVKKEEFLKQQGIGSFSFWAYSYF